MDIYQAIVLAILQGLTEFLPISSSAHLILVPVLLGWEDQGLAFDVAVHVGTLAAVVLYYRKDLLLIIRAWLRSLIGKTSSYESRLAWYVILGTIPACVVGISMPDIIETTFRSPIIIAGTTIIFALLLWWSEKTAREDRDQITLLDALFIGLFQAIAFIPGTSRSGITITAGLLSGLKRERAAQFSFLLSIPVIGLAGLVKGIELVQSTEPVMWNLIVTGILFSVVVAYLTIGWFLKLLQSIGMMPFVWYRLVLGIVLFLVFLR